MQALTIQASTQTELNSLPAPESSTVDMRRLGTRCWKALVNKGVSSKDAREVAIAITHLIYFNNPLSQNQQSLIDRHLSETDLLSLQLG